LGYILGDFLTLGGSMKITELAQNLGILFAQGKGSAQISTQNGLGYILGDFFHKLVWSPWL
jgi:hypothetical protein